MSKAKYNPLSAFREDPLAGLKQATAERDSIISKPTIGGTENRSAVGNYTERQESAYSESSPLHPPSFRTNPGAPLSSAPIKPLSSNLKPSRNTVYLYPEDLTKLRQLSGYAATEHGMRANDSMIVRAALSLIDNDVRFLHALKQAELSDRRRTVRASLDASR